MRVCVQWKYFQMKARSLFQILYRFSNGFALGRGASFRVVGDKCTFVGGMDTSMMSRM
jgi:hypothetical protein